MPRKLITCMALAVCFYGQVKVAPAQSIEALQNAVDLNPSSAKRMNNWVQPF